jgi:AraC-like DNA-binding protein
VRKAAPKKPTKVLAGLPRERALIAPIITGVFEELHIGAALHTAATERVFEEWHPLHQGPSTMLLEYEYGAQGHRWSYNERSIARAHREGKTFLGEHAGFSDFFVPLGRSAGALTTLVVGPVAVARPTSGDVLARWRWMAGGQAHFADPAFGQYLTTTLSILTLAREHLDDLRRLLGCFARLVDPRSDLDALSDEAQRLRRNLSGARAAEMMWGAARAMIDDRTARGWVTNDRTQELARLGVRKLPQHVIVGLLLGRPAERDPVDDLLRRDAFQRACAHLARKRGGLLCGPIGDHGVALLVEDPERGKPRLRDVAERASDLATRFGLKLFAGICPEHASSIPSQRYRMALVAAEQALSKGLPCVQAQPATDLGLSPLGLLRRELGRAIRENPSALSPRFQRYVEAASVHCGYRVDPIRAHLEAGFDSIAEALSASGTLDARSSADLRATVEQEAADADTVSALHEIYRRVVADIEHALLRPKDARHDRSFRRALSYIRDHIGDRLTRAGVARVAGFAEHYFSKRFRESEGVTFQKYVKNLRVERAKQLLVGTTLSVEQVGQLSGFASRGEFHRSFKQAAGVTPSAYRHRSRHVT